MVEESSEFQSKQKSHRERNSGNLFVPFILYNIINNLFHRTKGSKEKEQERSCKSSIRTTR